MEFDTGFIAAGQIFSELDAPVPAPYIRKSFALEALPQSADIVITGLGLYELYINGVRITKGLLSPYISNPDDVVCFDRYELLPYLNKGENVLGIILGNGFQNCAGGFVWDFHKAVWRGAPKTALTLTLSFPEHMEAIHADESFKTAPSPILFDDVHCGEHYDACREIPGWNLPGFDDSAWKPCVKAERPRGESRLCAAPPIITECELHPVSIVRQENDFLYDFGKNAAGLCRLNITGRVGQVITMYFGEYTKDGALQRGNLHFSENDDITQKEVYILKDGEQSYMPMFTYHGFRYVLVKGLLPEQATEALLTYCVMHSDVPERGGFTCSDETVNKLQQCTRRSTLDNLYHFPTDCPHREKNGWTADAALSAEHSLLNLGMETIYSEWMINIRKSMNDAGALPGIIPTGGWGFHWGNGPAWDCVLTYLPYFTYIYRGDEQIIKDNAHAIMRYIEYLTTRKNSNGLISIGLGDWCQVTRATGYTSPLEVTDTLISMDICDKAAYMFDVIGMIPQRDFAFSVYNEFRQSARENLIDFSTMTVLGNCQTSQSMAIFYNLFESGEKTAAFNRLLDIIKISGGHIDIGVLGARVLFHVLSDFGYSDLALDMIIRPDYPSYGWWIANGATTLWEDFQKESTGSRNHHFWGDISHWFIRHLSGICYRPGRVAGKLNICPKFVNKLNCAEGFHIAPEGEIRVKWERQEDAVLLSVSVPDTLCGYIVPETGWKFLDGDTVKPLSAGEYTLILI